LTPYDQNRSLQNIRSALFRQLQEHPFRDFVLARAAQKAIEDGRSAIVDGDVEDSLDEFRRSRERTTSWSGFYYAVGGAILSAGVGLWLTGYFFSVFTLYQLLPFVFLSLLGLLLIFVGVDQE
jgi:hypothetical protein